MINLFRLVIPAFPEVNIFTRQAKKTTALGPVMVATVANKLPGWRAEVIDENNYKGPRDSQGLPDHLTLQKENPAAVVGFYCGLSSTMERVWELAEFYQGEGVTTIAGGWHAYYCPEETLNHNIDVLVRGDGEAVIQDILKGAKPDASEVLVQDLNDLPYPDFGLLRYAKIKTYPIGRIRGCSMNCEFCSVKGKARWASAQHLFDTVRWLVETRRARHFFIVDDRLEEDLNGALEFFKRIAEKYGNRLHFSVQIRLDTAENAELLEVMKKAGVRYACIGCESPIDEDLKAMRKGYSSSKMLERVKILRRYLWTHLMFMVGYPLKERQKTISPKEILRCFRRFIRKSSPDTVQILFPVPIPGSDLRQRLKKEGRVFLPELVPWRYYDGSYPCFRPDNMSLQQLQEIGMKLMSRFYNPWSFIRVPLRILVFLFDLFIRGWGDWYRGWKKDIIQCGGYFLIRQWRKKQRIDDFIERLEKH